MSVVSMFCKMCFSKKKTFKRFITVTFTVAVATVKTFTVTVFIDNNVFFPFFGKKHSNDTHWNDILRYEATCYVTDPVSGNSKFPETEPETPFYVTATRKSRVGAPETRPQSRLQQASRRVSGNFLSDTGTGPHSGKKKIDRTTVNKCHSSRGKVETESAHT